MDSVSIFTEGRKGRDTAESSPRYSDLFPGRGIEAERSGGDDNRPKHLDDDASGEWTHESVGRGMNILLSPYDMWEAIWSQLNVM